MNRETRKEDTVYLPVGWWARLYDLIVRPRPQGWDSVANFCLDSPQIAYKTLVRARERGHTSRRSFNTLVNKLGFPSAEALEKHLNGERLASAKDTAEPVRKPYHDSPLETQIRSSDAAERMFTNQYNMPQWADPWEIDLGNGRLETLSCTIETKSAYFRFGFKLMTEHGRLFGDGSILSQDANLVVHIGRNNWDRTNPPITTRDIFLTWYENGIKRGKDARLFAAGARAVMAVRLAIDSGNVAQFFVNDECCLKAVIPPEIRRRLVMIAWGDTDEYEVRVTRIRVHTTPAP